MIREVGERWAPDGQLALMRDWFDFIHGVYLEFRPSDGQYVDSRIRTFESTRQMQIDMANYLANRLGCSYRDVTIKPRRREFTGDWRTRGWCPCFHSGGCIPSLHVQEEQ